MSVKSYFTEEDQRASYFCEFEFNFVIDMTKFLVPALLICTFAWYVHTYHIAPKFVLSFSQDTAPTNSAPTAQAASEARANPTSDLVLPNDMGRTDDRPHYTTDGESTNN